MSKFNSLYYKILQEPDWKETGWEDTNDDGERVKVTISQFIKFLDNQNIPVKELDVKDLAHLRIHKGKTDQETTDRVNRADLQHPIIIVNNKRGPKILDGHHRLQKAVNNNIEKIKARSINIDNLPEKWKFLFE